LQFYDVEVLNDAGGYVFQPPADAPDATDHIDATVPLSHPQPTAVPGVTVVAVGAQGARAALMRGRQARYFLGVLGDVVCVIRRLWINMFANNQ
jgi:hypothetical protein